MRRKPNARIKRIRYEPTVLPEVLQSKDVFIVGIKQYIIRLDIRENIYRIYELTSKGEQFIKEETCKSLHMAKMRAKNSIMGLGYVFDQELRNTDV